MQAPTTPSDRPDHGSDERTCPGCGAANGLTAAFCWQCYRPFGAMAPPPGAAGAPAEVTHRPPLAPPPTYGSPRSPSAWTPSPGPFDLPAPTPTRSVGTILGVVVLTVAAIAGAWWFLNRGAAVTMPDGFGGLALIENEQTAIAVEGFAAEAEGFGIEGEMALYGNGTPTSALIWIHDASVPTTDEAFDQFATGFDSGIGASGSLDDSRKTSELIEGVTYICAPVESVAPGTICMWQDDEIFWLLFEFSGQPMDAGQDLAVVAHDAISAT